METVKVHNKEFALYLSAEQIAAAIKKLAVQLNKELADKDVLFVGILNGSFLFAADLFRLMEFDCQITFLKLASYEGTFSTGKVKRLIGLEQDIRGKTIVIIEDIVDTGVTLDFILKQLNGYGPKDIKFVTLLFKPEAYIKQQPIDYVCFEIPDKFVIGYGLDYNGFGRNLQHIYSAVE